MCAATIQDSTYTVGEVIDRLQQLRHEAIELEQSFADRLAMIPESHRESAANLLHYLSVRQHDIRHLQEQLHAMGLSSLGRMEAYVLPTLEAVLKALHKLADRLPPQYDPHATRFDFHTGRTYLARNTEALFGPTAPDQDVRIMITMPSEAAERYELIRDLVEAGMNIMRINCAKDDPDRWRKMIEHLRRAERELGRSCRIEMDLAGPNPRTGPLTQDVGVVYWRPDFDRTGQVNNRALLWLTASGTEPKAADQMLPVDASLLRQIKDGDDLRVMDTRGRWKELYVTHCEEHGCWAEADEEAFVEQGAALELMRDGKSLAQGQVLELPRSAVEQEYRVRVGDQLVLTRDNVPGRPPRRDQDGHVIEPASIGCTLSEVLRDVSEGDRVFYDDGEFGAVVREVTGDRVVVEVTQARNGSAKIQSEKGMNFPDTHFDLPTLTAKDLDDLDFIVKHADVLGMSFVRRVSNIEDLIRELQRRQATSLGIVIKIETEAAFDDLPALLLAAMQSPPVSVMVARGDMGVELGFNRMSEVQEEILWFCEAAHVPVVWATQVLEDLAKKGLPTRAEVTDAAMSGRAECVMLNKGEYIVETVRFLCDILQRMQHHQRKKMPTLRKLRVSDVKAPR
jgi:pyruvate kinase